MSTTASVRQRLRPSPNTSADMAWDMADTEATEATEATVASEATVVSTTDNHLMTSLRDLTYLPELLIMFVLQIYSKLYHP